ncbi:MAG: hypothetical protein ACQ9ET_00715 [Nitrosomonadaceae bacterium]
MALSATQKDGGIQVMGDDLLIKKLKKLQTLGARQSEIRAAFNRAIKPMTMAARNNAKQSTNSKRKYKRGPIWKSIKVVLSRRYKNLFWLGPARGKKQRFDGWYGFFLEKGARNRKTEQGANRGSIRGTKYMEKAYNAHKRGSFLKIRFELFKLIKKYSR